MSSLSSASKSDAQLKKRRVKKEIPIPIIVPEALFVAIRLSCVVHALDENPNNRLNENRDPITREYVKGNRRVVFVCYTPDFIKSWLRILLATPIWRDVIEVPKSVKDKFGASILSTSENINVSCLRIPTDAEIAASVDHNESMTAALIASRDVIRDVLLGPKDLLHRGDVALGTAPNPEAIASPTNICKVSRLEALSMSRAALSSSERKRWDDFYRSEKARIAYVSNMINATRVSDTILRSLSESEAIEYNKQMMETAASVISNRYASGATLEDAISVRSSGTKVNPALVHLYDTASKAKASKDEKSDVVAQYKAMCKRYFTLTGHRLDYAVEKKAGTIDLRIGDIAWATKLRESNPMYTFMHYSPTDRIRATQGVMAEESHNTEVKPVEVEQEKPVAPAKKPKALKPKSSKMFATGTKHEFTNPKVYSIFKPVKIDKSATDIQEHIARATNQGAQVQDDEEGDDAYYGEEEVAEGDSPLRPDEEGEDAYFD